MKIDKTEFFRAFVVLEAALVGFPVIVWRLAFAARYLLGGFDALTFCLALFFLVARSYFALPALLAPALFQGTVPAAVPEGIGGWLVVVGVYSVLALLFALPVSIRTPSRRHSRSRATRPAATGGGKAAEAHEAEAGNKTDGAT